MSSEWLQVEMGKREREKGKDGGAFIPPHTESRYSSKTRNILEKPRNFEKSRDSRKNPETPAFQGQHPKS
jgi:hypothetical protein